MQSVSANGPEVHTALPQNIPCTLCCLKTFRAHCAASKHSVRSLTLLPGISTATANESTFIGCCVLIHLYWTLRANSALQLQVAGREGPCAGGARQHTFRACHWCPQCHTVSNFFAHVCSCTATPSLINLSDNSYELRRTCYPLLNWK